MFKEFNELYGLETKAIDHDLESMHKLINDEVVELGDEILPVINPNIPFTYKEALDVVYIACQQMTERGFDVEKGLAELHRSNMSKSLSFDEVTIDEITTAMNRYPNASVVEAGNKYVLKCTETGKVIKPKRYSPAVITSDMWGK